MCVRVCVYIHNTPPRAPAPACPAPPARAAARAGHMRPGPPLAVPAPPGRARPRVRDTAGERETKEYSSREKQRDNRGRVWVGVGGTGLHNLL